MTIEAVAYFRGSMDDITFAHGICIIVYVTHQGQHGGEV